MVFSLKTGVESSHLNSAQPLPVQSPEWCSKLQITLGVHLALYRAEFCVHLSDIVRQVVLVKTQQKKLCKLLPLNSSQRLIEDETFNDSDIIINLIDYEDGEEEPDSLRADKNMQGSSFPTNWKSIFLK
ncbi:hypothetical protein TNCV_2433711 [Trichonephila clavipes]|nr:hypothetical protein TNCV_2433711 [Trichonephila clavipes]